MAKKLLITDAYNPIGTAISLAFEHANYGVLMPEKAVLDYTNTAALVDYCRDHRIDLVINTFGWSDVPSGSDRERLVTMAKHLAEACVVLQCPVLHLSSYRVFGGENKTAYDELDQPSPLGSAGFAFWEAERAFEQRLERYICLRIGWLIDIHPDSYLSKVLSSLSTPGATFEVGHQRRGAPISSTVVGRIVVAMVNQILCGAENWGVYHCASSDPCTVAEFTEAVVAVLEREDSLRREWAVTAPIAEDAELAFMGSPEPDSSVLTVRRSRDDFGVQAVSWRQGLAGLIRIWLARQQDVDAG